jgi:hypothetical protein
VKIVCAWCQKTTGYKCPFCGEPLTDPPEQQFIGRFKVCNSEPTQIYFSIDRMQKTHGICDDCSNREAIQPALERRAHRQLSAEDKANLAAAAAATSATAKAQAEEREKP